MKVLKIIHTLGHGGAENVFRQLASGLLQEGVEVIAAIPRVSDPRQENWIAPALEEYQVPFTTFDKSGGPLRLLMNMSAVVRQAKPHIVHSHLLDSNFYSALACRLLSVPHVCTEHGDVSFKQTVLSRVKYRVISSCSNSIICVSDAVRESAERLVPDGGKLKTVYNGINFLEKKRSTFRAEIGIPAYAFLIGNVGNLYVVKGQKYLIRAFAELLPVFPQAFLALVGRGGEEQNLRQLTGELDIPSGRVIFTGFRNDIENVMNAFDLYVQPSKSEGHPIAVLEAMSLGIPVIATAVGGIPEVLRQGQYGTLATPESWEHLCGCIMDYVRNPVKFQERALLAKHHVRERFSIQNMARSYVETYQQALAQWGKSHRKK
jgi:glycosyltransferase involved in cell wall biosynthesis